MKVKVGDKTYDSVEQPIMVILTEKDKYNIEHMDEDAYRYAAYDKDNFDSHEDILAWMEVHG